MNLFLIFNHYALEVEHDTLYQAALDTASSQLSKKEIAHFFKLHIKSF
jgi:prophage maintenance system killer protein